MMSFRMNVNMEGLKQLRGEVENKIKEIVHIGAIGLGEYERGVFNSQGKLAGSEWKPITERTKKKRAKYGVNPNNPILQARGVLVRSFNTGYTVGFPESEINLKFGVVLSEWDEHRIDLVKAHHEGNPPRYPKRPLFTSETAVEYVTRFINEKVS
jgi:hypothetical protein